MSFPVGKVDFLNLLPLSFKEFLDAMGETDLLALLEKGDWNLIRTFAPRYVDLLKHYYFVGGMPEAVMVFADGRDFIAVRNTQRRILLSYEQDFSKHAPHDIVPRIRMVWNAIPAQLAKENRKFIYRQIRQGARARDYELAIAWLKDCGLIHQINNVTKPGLPLKAAFKLFLVDVGLLIAMVDLDVRTLLEGHRVFQEFKGALTEQYVLQQLLTIPFNTYYWSPNNARSEIDFIIQTEGKIIPIEVKAEENLRPKSLRVYCEKFNPPHAIRTSMSNYRKESWMTNLPLYAINVLETVVKL